MSPILNQNENLSALLSAYNETKYAEGKAAGILYKAKKDLVTALVSITASLGLLSLTYLRLDMLDKSLVSTGYIIGVCGLLLYANWTGRLLLDIQRTNFENRQQ